MTLSCQSSTQECSKRQVHSEGSQSELKKNEEPCTLVLGCLGGNPRQGQSMMDLRSYLNQWRGGVFKRLHDID